MELNKKQLQELQTRSYKITMLDKDGKTDIASIGVDKYTYKVKDVNAKEKYLRVERID